MKPKSRYSQHDFQFARFSLSSREFGLDVRDVKEIIRLKGLERPSGTPAFIDGFVWLRTILVPVIDLRKKFSLPAPLEDKTRVLVCLVESRIAGLVVDKVTEIAEEGGQEAGSKPPDGPWAGCVDAVINTSHGPVMMLSLKGLLSNEERKALSGPIGGNDIAPDAD